MGATTGTNDSDDAVAKLKTACDEAYAKYGSSCSHAVWYVITAIVDKDFKWLDANHLVDFLTSSLDWNEVSVEPGWALALKGIAVIGGLKKPGDHGHVILMYPDQKRPSGGYSYSYKDKKTGKMTNAVMRSHGNYPPALSTSLGPWPGAKSKGDKTIWDPWANDDAFAQVKFWTKK